MIAEFEALIPRSDSIWNKSGAVFYSGKAAFSAPSRLYILGLNPGGDPKDKKMADCTVEKHTETVFGKPDNWSEYTDVSCGEYPLQRRLRYLLEELNLVPELTPASNVVFVRSRREKDIEQDFEKYAKCCWSFHEAVIEKLKVRAVLCLGKRAGNWVLAKYGLKSTNPYKMQKEKNNRQWTNSYYISSCGIRIFVATHPSIADWTNPDTDPSPLVRDMLDTLT